MEERSQSPSGAVTTNVFHNQIDYWTEKIIGS